MGDSIATPSSTTEFGVILATGESIIRDNADRLTSCLVLATEERS